MSDRLGDYRLEELVGRGGMAEVHRAVGVNGPNRGRVVAIKKLLPEHAADPIFVDAFVSEADVSRTLRHPAIVSVLETGIQDDSYFIVMDYIEGKDLAQLIRAAGEKGEQLPIDICCYIAHVVALALDYAHRLRSKMGDPLGLVHCDVTPSNIFIGRDGKVMLGDFGVAHSRLVATQLNEKGIAGKVAYLAPEQIAEQRLSPATDVFALGAVLFEMITGRRAFEGKGNKAIMKRILSGDVPRLSAVRKDVPAKIDAIVAKALATDRPTKEAPTLTTRMLNALPMKRETRYATAAHFAIDLEGGYAHYKATDTAIADVARRLFV